MNVNMIRFGSNVNGFTPFRGMEFCYNPAMPGKRKPKHAERPVFDSIRKPTAPPSRKIGTDQADEKRVPSLRKAKHKKDPDLSE